MTLSAQLLFVVLSTTAMTVPNVPFPISFPKVKLSCSSLGFDIFVCFTSLSVNLDMSFMALGELTISPEESLLPLRSVPSSDESLLFDFGAIFTGKFRFGSSIMLAERKEDGGEVFFLIFLTVMKCDK